MELVKGDEVALRWLLDDATRDQLVLLNRRFGIAAAELRMSPRFAAHAKRGSESDLSFFVVTQGRKAWSDALKNPRRLPKSPPARAPDFVSVMADVYRARFHDEIPEQEPDPAKDRSLRYDPAFEAQLWKLIDVVNAGVPLEEATSGYTRSELTQLNAAILVLLNRLCVQFEERFGEDPDGLAWCKWTDWMIGRGLETIEHYLAHPKKAPRTVPNDARFFAGDLDLVYEERYGAHIPPIRKGLLAR